MSTGVFKVGSGTEETLTPKMPTLSDATNIREVTLVFKRGLNDIVIPPFIEYGNISYSANYFLIPFERLQRVQIGVPQPWFRKKDSETLQAEKEESYMSGIKMVNSRLGVLGKLLWVPALQIEEDPWVPEEESRVMYSIEGWFWQAAEGTFLKSSKKGSVATSTSDNHAYGALIST